MSIFCFLGVFISFQISVKVEGRSVACGGKPADVIFILDSSNSIWNPDFKKQLQFVKDVVDWFTIGADAMRVGVITYSDYPQLQFHLPYYSTKTEIHVAIDSIRQMGGYHTNTADALRYMTANILSSDGSHARPGNVAKVGIVLTDGQSDNTTATALEAATTKRAGIHLFAVGIGANCDLLELEAIASVPTSHYTFLVENYAGLGRIRELLAIKTCGVTDPPTTITTTTTTTTTKTLITRKKSASGKENDDAKRGDDRSDKKRSKQSKLSTPSSILSQVGRTPVILTPPSDKMRRITDRFNGSVESGVDTLNGAERRSSYDTDEDRSSEEDVDDNNNGTNRWNRTSRISGINDLDEKNGTRRRNNGSSRDDMGGGSGSSSSGLTSENGGYPNKLGSDRGRRGGYWVYDEYGHKVWYIRRLTKQLGKNTGDEEHDDYDDSGDNDGDDVRNKLDRTGVWRRDDRGILTWYKYVSPGVYRREDGQTIRIPQPGSESGSDDYGLGSTNAFSSSGNDGYWTLDKEGRKVWHPRTESQRGQRTGVGGIGRHKNDSSPHVYISSGPGARGGYWLYDPEEEGHVWHNYDPETGLFEKDVNSTIEYHEMQQRLKNTRAKTRNGSEDAVSSEMKDFGHVSKGRWLLDNDGRPVWQSFGESLILDLSHNNAKNISSEDNNATATSSSDKGFFKLGYWIRDSFGRRVWRPHHRGGGGTTSGRALTTTPATLLGTLRQSDVMTTAKTVNSQTGISTSQFNPNITSNISSAQKSGSTPLDLSSTVSSPSHHPVVQPTVFPKQNSSTAVNNNAAPHNNYNASDMNTSPAVRAQVQFVTAASATPNTGSGRPGLWRFDADKKLWFQLPPSLTTENDSSQAQSSFSGTKKTRKLRPSDVAGTPEITSDKMQSAHDETLWSFDERRRRIYYKTDDDDITNDTHEVFASNFQTNLARVATDDEEENNNGSGSLLWNRILGFDEGRGNNTRMGDLGKFPEGIRIPESISQELRAGEARIRARNPAEPAINFERTWFYDDNGRKMFVLHRYNESEGRGSISTDEMPKFNGAVVPELPERHDFDSKEYMRFGRRVWQLQIRPALGDSESASLAAELNRVSTNVNIATDIDTFDNETSSENMTTVSSTVATTAGVSFEDINTTTTVIINDTTRATTIDLSAMTLTTTSRPTSHSVVPRPSTGGPTTKKHFGELRTTRRTSTATSLKYNGTGRLVKQNSSNKECKPKRRLDVLLIIDTTTYMNSLYRFTTDIVAGLPTADNNVRVQLYPNLPAPWSNASQVEQLENSIVFRRVLFGEHKSVVDFIDSLSAGDGRSEAAATGGLAQFPSESQSETGIDEGVSGRVKVNNAAAAVAIARPAIPAKKVAPLQNDQQSKNRTVLGDKTRRVVVFMTDGRSDDFKNVLTALAKLKTTRKDVEIVAVGIGTRIKRKQLEVVASLPTKAHLRLLISQANAEKFAAEMRKRLCR